MTGEYGRWGYRVRCRRRARASATAPAASDERPRIGPESELPVTGREPPVEFVLVRADSDVEVEPNRPVIGEMVVVGVTVEPSGPTEVLDTVVDGANVVDEVVVVVTSVVLVLVVGGEHVDANVTDADPAAWKPSGQVASRDRVMSPVSAPGTIVLAEVVALLATSE
jgi:hypothetical protein